MELGHKTGAANERLLSAARSHAVQVLRVIDPRAALFWSGGSKEQAPAFRSLGVAEEDATRSYAPLYASDGDTDGHADMPASNKKRKHDAAPEFKGIGAVDAAYKERKVVDGRGPSAPRSRTMPCGARKACLCCHAGLSREQVKQAVGLVQAAQALLISAVRHPDVRRLTLSFHKKNRRN